MPLKLAAFPAVAEALWTCAGEPLSGLRGATCASQPFWVAGLRVWASGVPSDTAPAGQVPHGTAFSLGHSTFP